MKEAVFLFFILVLLSSCKKVRPFVSTDKRQFFKNAYLTHFSNFKIYTRNGEIKNSALAQAYANEFTRFFYDSTNSFTDPEFQVFVLVNDDSIINVSRNAVEATRKNIDTYDKFSSKFTNIINDTNAINLHIIKYKLLQQKTSAGVVYYEIESPVYFLKKISDTLFFPIVRYITISRKDYVVSFSADKFNNVFSIDGLNKLGQYDTLVVQSFDLAMKKTQ